ncbi:MAG TPA: transglycosylase SLT domain-containing protein [Sandaracinaceae bacterium]
MASKASIARCAALLSILACAASASAQSPDDPLAGVAELTAARSDEAALAALERLPAPVRSEARTRYLRARLLDRLGRFAEAADSYPTDGALPAPVRRDAARRRAIALARAGRCGPARDALAALGDEPLAQARLAECALAAGQLDEAIRRLREVVRRGAAEVDLFAARYQLAEALARRGDRDEAIATLTELIVERPEHPEAPLATRALEALRGRPVALTFEQRMRRAARFRERRMYDEALAELEAAGRPRAREALREWLHLRGMSLFDSRRRYEEAARVLAESARLGGAHAADDEFHAARALSRANRDLEAVRAYRRFAAAHPRHRRAPEALYLAAWLEMRHGVRGAERRMQAFLRSEAARREPGLARDGLWMLALRAFERRQYARAATLFSQYAETDSDVLVRARGLYWVGRAKHRRDRRGAIAAYREAMRVEPLHWYALLARQRLIELGEDPGPPFPEPPEPGELAPVSVELPEDVRFYAALGLRADAREALRRHEGELRRRADGDDGLRALIAAYAELEEPARLRRLAAGARLHRSARAPGPRDRWRWDAAYPRPWAEHARAAASAVGLLPAHLYAVMWQESGFDPDAVSYADAIGLMQLLPSTAERVAQGLGIEITRDMLFDPTVNLLLGATYVGGLARRFGVPLCFAAFNAGGHRVQAWLEERGEIELDLFVEHIPYAQTRNYVRRVTTHLARYLYLEDPSRGWPPLELPRTVSAPAR